MSKWSPAFPRPGSGGWLQEGGNEHSRSVVGGRTLVFAWGTFAKVDTKKKIDAATADLMEG